MTRLPRAATPVPVDPGQPESFLKKLEGWKVLISIAVALVGGAAAWTVWQTGLATKADVERARAGTAAAIDQMREQTLDLRFRLPVVEGATADLKKDTTIIRAQLFEIARTVGAPQVQPQPALTAPAP
jgi:hypothetical protein